MIAASSPPSDRLDELLVDRALFGLTAADALELERMLADRAGLDLEIDEKTAAMLELALGPARYEPLPQELRRRILQDAEEWVSHRSSGGQKGSELERLRVVERRPTLLLRLSPFLAAAALVLAALGWWRQPTPLAPADLAVQRQELLTRADVLQVAWSTTDEAPGARGDVVWDQDGQQGFLRIAGLAVNDPGVEQYQLWIFDADQEHPVDGGVFDMVVVDGEALIPIDAKIAVSRPTVFAVTIEKPGGVVVSKRERVALLAQV